MSALSGASTFAVGKVASGMFETGGSLVDIDLDSARAAYETSFQEGKRVVSDIRETEKPTYDVFEALEKLG